MMMLTVKLPEVDGMWVLSEMYALMDRCGDAA